MVRGGARAVGTDDVVYEPLPEMDSEELARLRAVIGFADDDSGAMRSRRPSRIIDLRDGDEPRSYLEEVLEEVDRKLEKLLDGGPVTVVNDGYGAALGAVHGEIEVLRVQVKQLQSSLDRLTRSLMG